MRPVLVSFLSALVACTDVVGGDAGVDGTGVDAANPDPSPGPMIRFDFSESTADFLTPERGFYVGYDLLGGSNATSIRNSGHTLAIALVNLHDYRTRPLDAALLTSLASGFASVRASGAKVILRFTYNDALDADASKAQILDHIQQLTPLIQANADVIAVMQAGFIGAWGEWHSSTNGLDNDADRTAILGAILAAAPASRGVQVRTPMFKAAAFPGGPMDEVDAFDGSPRARVGHHDDCFLASDTDFGTYASPVAEWKSYVAQDSRYTAVGGETCAVNPPRSDCAEGVAEMTANHWSYLNREYNQAVIDRWDAQGCGDEIRTRLGYRFALDQVGHTESVAPGGELTLELTLHNSGFAAPYNRRPVEIVLADGEARRVVRLADVDARRWAPGATTVLAVRLRIPADVTPGPYRLSLRLPDDDDRLAGDPRYAIRLANDGVWDEATGENVLTRTLVVDDAAPGARDPSARDFAELR